jgi:hypothetical protein
VLKWIARKNNLSSVATLTAQFQTASERNVHTITAHWEIHEIGFHGPVASHKPKITICIAKRSWRGIKLAASGYRSSGNAFSGVMNHALPSGSPTDESGFGGCQENTTCPNA